MQPDTGSSASRIVNRNWAESLGKPNARDKTLSRRFIVDENSELFVEVRPLPESQKWYTSVRIYSMMGTDKSVGAGHGGPQSEMQLGRGSM